MKQATLGEKYLNFMCTLNYFLLLRRSIVGLQETILKTTFAPDSAAVKTQIKYLGLHKEKKEN